MPQAINETIHKARGRNPRASPGTGGEEPWRREIAGTEPAHPVAAKKHGRVRAGAWQAAPRCSREMGWMEKPRGSDPASIEVRGRTLQEPRESQNGRGDASTCKALGVLKGENPTLLPNHPFLVFNQTPKSPPDWDRQLQVSACATLLTLPVLVLTSNRRLCFSAAHLTPLSFKTPKRVPCHARPGLSSAPAQPQAHGRGGRPTASLLPRAAPRNLPAAGAGESPQPKKSLVGSPQGIGNRVVTRILTKSGSVAALRGKKSTARGTVTAGRGRQGPCCNTHP